VRRTLERLRIVEDGLALARHGSSRDDFRETSHSYARFDALRKSKKLKLMILIEATHAACFESFGRVSGICPLGRPTRFFWRAVAGCAESQAPDSVEVSLGVPVD
jgi:hypothetical protein